uniref:Uncharacterized protein n=1 Tax=Amphiprion percula TaxID=161767 RepID=A0A3P8RZE3_AMPPE
TVCSWIGRCKCSFWFAVAHDILGIFIMMVGVFGGLIIHDLFIYAGAIIIFLSLIWWVFWYAGNIDLVWCAVNGVSGLKTSVSNKLNTQILLQIILKQPNIIHMHFLRHLNITTLSTASPKHKL